VRELEALQGQTPLWLVDRHPDGRHVVMRTGWSAGDEGERTGVWDEQTGELVWAPQAAAMCWLRGGSELALVTEQYSGDFERWSWPGRERLSRGPLSHRDGWVDDLAVSPKDDLAAVRWIDQTEAGFELIAIGDENDEQLKGKRWRVGGTNLVDGPVFSPSGRFLALSVGHAGWWRTGADVDGPSEGGRFEAGRAVVFDTKDGSTRELPIDIEVPAGWEPASDEAEAGLLGEPRFASPRSFVITLPTGEERKFGTGARASRGRRRPSSAR
jgi:hypothetical protein